MVNPRVELLAGDDAIEAVLSRCFAAEFHRESCLYLPCRFSQLSTEIPGDVLFPQDGPPKITQLSKQIEKFHRFAEEDSCSINVKVIKHGLRFDGFRRRFASCSPFTVGIEGAGPFFQG